MSKATHHFSVYVDGRFKCYSRHSSEEKAESERQKRISEGASCSPIEYSDLNDDGDCDRYN